MRRRWRDLGARHHCCNVIEDSVRDGREEVSDVVPELLVGVVERVRERDALVAVFDGISSSFLIWPVVTYCARRGGSRSCSSFRLGATFRVALERSFRPRQGRN